MNIEEIRDYCLSLPETNESFPFDETTLVFKVKGKMFAMTDLEHTEWLSVKCEPEYAQELRAKYTEIEGAYHMNKKYWNQINVQGSLNTNFVEKLINHSYNEVVKKMPKKERENLPFLDESE
ncbi:MAG: MmcQ/YjbR family DNA-binding protein [Paludibacteraceae bacterium]|nr:MmcQ/YjbR family DNA-binding protein [Paludibacteraceae bacterium]